MLRRIEICDFQSVEHASIPLGGVTVITGPTGAGKSAMFRAMYLLARNGRGVDRFIRAGRKSLSVAARGDGWAVRLTRSGARGRNEYVLAREADGWKPEPFTKTGGAVPDEIAAALQLSELNFARQGRPAFLLDVPATEVARTLGALTNVSLVLGAAAEAGRLRKRHQHDLDRARERRAALLGEAQEFAGLNVERAAIAVAEAALESAQAAAVRASRLAALLQALEQADLARVQAQKVAELHEPPSLEQLEQLAGRVARLSALTSALDDAGRQQGRYRVAAEQAVQDAKTAEQELHAALAAAGECPVCGQPVS